MEPKREILNEEYKATVQQWVPMSIWDMELGTVFTKHKSGYDPATDTHAIYMKVSKVKCLDLIRGTKHSIPVLFGLTGVGYPLSIPWLSILRTLEHRSH